MGNRDCSKEELKYIEHFISTVEFNEYDRLIQLCDAIAPAPGFCLIEKRMVDVALRLGIKDHTLRGWQARFQIKDEMEIIIGRSIYQILPGVIEGTFGASMDTG
jgi:hypothetical protein